MIDGSGKRVIYQGEEGANSHIACREVFPDSIFISALTFEDAFFSLSNGDGDLAMIPIENSIAGRVADIHHLLPESGFYIVGEHFMDIRHHLLALPGVSLSEIRHVNSHIHALGQCRRMIRENDLQTHISADTAGAARELASSGLRDHSVIASSLAGEIYGLETVLSNVEDSSHNRTRFVILSPSPMDADLDVSPVITSFIFRVRNVPASLYKALGGFATNGVNMTKLESYQLGGSFSATQFYADIEGHPESRPVRLALEELAFFTSELRILGVYAASSLR